MKITASFLAAAMASRSHSINVATDLQEHLVNDGQVPPQETSRGQALKENVLRDVTTRSAQTPWGELRRFSNENLAVSLQNTFDANKAKPVPTKNPGVAQVNSKMLDRAHFYDTTIFDKKPPQLPLMEAKIRLFGEPAKFRMTTRQPKILVDSEEPFKTVRLNLKPLGKGDDYTKQLGSMGDNTAKGVGEAYMNGVKNIVKIL